MPSRLFWGNLAALIGVAVANYLWFRRYTALFDDNALWSVAGILTAVTVAGGFVLKFVDDDRFKAVRTKVSDVLNDRHLWPWVFGVGGLELVGSVFFGGIEVRNPAGAGEAVEVRVYRAGESEPVASDQWEPKQAYHDGFWAMKPWASRAAEIRVAGTPRREVPVSPWWHFRRGLEFPKDFVRPVVLVTADAYLVKKAAAAKSAWRLTVTVNESAAESIAYDGRSVWVGCREADDMTVPPAARVGWASDTDPLLRGTVFNPKEYPGRTGPLPDGCRVSAVITDDAGDVRTAPAVVAVSRPTTPDGQIHVLVLYVP